MTHTIELELTNEEIARDEALYEAERDIMNEISNIESELEDYDGHCSSCEAAMINSVYCHETGCPTDRRLRQLHKQLDSLNDF